MIQQPPMTRVNGRGNERKTTEEELHQNGEMIVTVCARKGVLDDYLHKGMHIELVSVTHHERPTVQLHRMRICVGNRATDLVFFQIRSRSTFCNCFVNA